MPTTVFTNQFNLAITFILFIFFIHECDGLEDPAVSVQYITQSALHELAKDFNCDLLKIKC